MKQIIALCAVFTCGMLFGPQSFAAQARPTRDNRRIDLVTGWAIQSSAKVSATGDAVSQPGFNAASWYAATAPTTVLSALVADKVYPDPYFGINLLSYPGMSYPIGFNFSNIPAQSDNPFAIPWWYRTEFRLPRSSAGKRLWLNFDSINYRANVWLNGKLIADSNHVRGMYRMFELDVTDAARPGEVNALAVEVYPPTPSDLSITFVDWNPMPPGQEMGLVRDVYLLSAGPVTVRNTQVITKLADDNDAADLTIYTDLRNATDRAIEGVVRTTVEGVALEHGASVPAHGEALVVFTPADYPDLHVLHPDLWWPSPLGKQTLYTLRTEFVTGGKVSDSEVVKFGIREVTSEIDAQQHRLFKINGKPILIRGGGWTQDMLLRYSPEREEQELRYVRDMHLNAVRLEGKLMNDHFFETCDRYGILVIAGWCCCSHWEQWDTWVADDFTIAGESERDQIRRLRNHPCLLAWLYGSDDSPPQAAESVYLNVLQQERWPNPYVSGASSNLTVGAGITGVKMTGPYNYVAPNYWLLDKQRGGAFGFNTETSPGPAIPEMESLARMLPKEHLWPIDDYWNYHAGGGAFRTLQLFNDALDHRYGKARDLQDYVRKSQLMAYEGERAMFEAFGRNKYGATGVIQWMLNNAWPSVIWHLYDYYFCPGGGYFGAKKACEPLHVQFAYDDRFVTVVNSWYRSFDGLRVLADVIDIDGKTNFTQTNKLDAGPDSVTRAFAIPVINTPSKVYFLRLRLEDRAGKLIGSNVYWLSSQDDVSDWNGSNWEHTPIATFADFTGLQSIPETLVAVTHRSERQGDGRLERISLKNTSSYVALAIHLRLVRGRSGEEIEPVLWEDNYITLAPGESRDITASYDAQNAREEPARMMVDGWNVHTQNNGVVAVR